MSRAHPIGCAFGTRAPTLYYPPASEPGAASAVNAQATANPKNLRVVVQPFVDYRKDKSKVGTVRNGFGMPTADVVSTNNVADWFTRAVKTELQNSGYTVLAHDYARRAARCSRAA